MTPADAPDAAAVPAPPRGGFRRSFAAGLASSYGVILFVIWSLPLTSIAVKAIDKSPHVGWAAVAGAVFGYLSFLLLPAGYYALRPWERSGKFYRTLGVKRFRYVVGLGDGVSQLARRIDPHWQNPLARMSYRDRVAWQRMFEGSHWGFVFGSIPLIALAFYQGRTTLGWAYVALHVPFSAYPIMLQRFARAQLERIGPDRFECHDKKTLEMSSGARALPTGPPAASTLLNSSSTLA